MLKAAFKNCFKHIHYVFLIAGVVYAFFLLVLGVIYAHFQGALIEQGDSALAELYAIFKTAFENITIPELMKNGLGSVIMYLTELLKESFYVSSGGLITMIVLGALIILLSFQLAGYLCRYSIRKNIKRKDTMRWYWAMLVRYAISIAFAIALAIALYYFFSVVIVLIVLFFALKGVANIIEVKLIYFRHKNLRHLLTFKNVGAYIFSSLLLLAVVALIVWLIAVLLNNWFAAVLGVPLIIYYFEIIKFTTVEYFKKQFNINDEEPALL